MGQRMIALLRGINIGPNNRIAMPALREALAEAGMPDARTYVQSGNIVLRADADPDALAVSLRELIAERFDLKIPVIVRTRDELAEVIARDPLADVVTEPKLYQVSFLSAAPDPDVIAEMQALAVGEERLVAIGRELYTWHAAGVARSKLWAALAGRKLGVTATARNWRTVTTLLEMADAD